MQLAERLAATRGVVIFADYLSDLAVLDLFSDLRGHPAPPAALLALLVGLVTGVAVADLMSGIAAWVSHRYIPPGTFQLFRESPVLDVPVVITTVSLSTVSHPPRPSPSPSLSSPSIPTSPPLPTTTSLLPSIPPPQTARRACAAVNVEPESTSRVLVLPAPPTSTEIARHASLPKCDVFSALVNSCFVCTPPLTIVASWAVSAHTIGLESMAVSALSLCALAPLLRAQSNWKDARVVAVLRKLRVLKPKDANGWTQICGVMDPVLDRVLPIVEKALTGIGVNPRESGE